MDGRNRISLRMIVGCGVTAFVLSAGAVRAATPVLPTLPALPEIAEVTTPTVSDDDATLPRLTKEHPAKEKETKATEKTAKGDDAGLQTIESSTIRSVDAATPVTATQGTTDVTAKPQGLYEKFAPVVQTSAALAIVVGLALLGRWLVKKIVPGAAVGSGKGVMEVFARYPLAKNQSLVLVRIGSQLVVLNQGRESSQSVLVVNEPLEVAKIIGQVEGAKPNSISAGFSNLLNGAQEELSQPESDDVVTANRMMEAENLDNQLDEMAAAKRQLMELRQQVRSMRDSFPLSK